MQETFIILCVMPFIKRRKKKESEMKWNEVGVNE